MRRLSYAVDGTGRTLKDYAQDIGVEYKTLENARSVCSQWREIPGAASITYGVLKVR